MQPHHRTHAETSSLSTKPPKQPSKKRWWIIGSAILLVIVIGIYGLLSFLAWKRVADQSRTASTELAQIRTKFSDAEDSKSTEAQQRQAIQNLASDPKADCHISALYAWQAHVVPKLRSKLDSCEQASSNIATYQASLSSLNALLTDEDAIAAILKNVAVDSTAIGENDWQTRLDASKKAAADLSKLTVSSAAQPVKKAAADSLAQITTAWSALIDARSKQDATAYDKAANSLGEAYESLAGVTAQSDKAYAGLSQKLES